MVVYYRTQGFVFKKNDFGEADRFYLIFTKDFGKLELLAKGVRKIRAKLKSSLELFNFSEIEFVQGRHYKTLTDALVIKSFPEIKKNLEKLKIAFEISELFDKLLKGEEKDERIWYLLEESFKELHFLKLKNKDSKLEVFYYYFFWNFLSLLGYQPQLQRCVVCQKRETLNRKVYFSVSEGGRVCSLCALKIKDKKPLSPSTLKLLKIILTIPVSFLKRLKVEKKDLKNLAKISRNYLFFIEKIL